jgi:hypothetical protein
MRKGFLVIGILLISACKFEQKPDYLLEKPKDLLSQETMVSIILEAHLKEAMVLETGIQYDSARKLFKSVYEPEILEKYGVDDSTYFKSYQYYISDPSNIQKIYGRVVDSLNIRKSLKKID